ncbi:MAG: hypothetical protein ACYDAQ_08315, partial [Mycobacteriales bacterium]
MVRGAALDAVGDGERKVAEGLGDTLGEALAVTVADGAAETVDAALGLPVGLAETATEALALGVVTAAGWWLVEHPASTPPRARTPVAMPQTDVRAPRPVALGTTLPSGRASCSRCASVGAGDRSGQPPPGPT